MNDSEIQSIQPEIRTDMVDIIIVSSRGPAVIEKILLETTQDPSKWARHHFIVLFDSEEQTIELTNWLSEKQEIIPLPLVTVKTSQAENRDNLNSLRQEALNIGSNPYVYFQDDDSILPQGLEKRMNMMANNNWMAVYGVTQTVNDQSRTVELFPAMHNGSFVIDPIKGSKLFPTYPHPLAALFKRELFKETPIDDGHKYKQAGEGALLVRITEKDIPFTFIPEVIRQVKRHRDGTPGIIQESIKERLIHDIAEWKSHITHEETANFHHIVSRRLEKGDITTYKEIDALIEATIEEMDCEL